MYKAWWLWLNIFLGYQVLRRTGILELLLTDSFLSHRLVFRILAALWSFGRPLSEVVCSVVLVNYLDIIALLQCLAQSAVVLLVFFLFRRALLLEFVRLFHLFEHILQGADHFLGVNIFVLLLSLAFALLLRFSARLNTMDRRVLGAIVTYFQIIWRFFGTGALLHLLRWGFTSRLFFFLILSYLLSFSLLLAAWWWLNVLNFGWRNYNVGAVFTFLNFNPFLKLDLLWFLCFFRLAGLLVLLLLSLSEQLLLMSLLYQTFLFNHNFMPSFGEGSGEWVRVDWEALIKNVQLFVWYLEVLNLTHCHERLENPLVLWEDVLILAFELGHIPLHDASDLPPLVRNLIRGFWRPWTWKI